MEQFNPYNAQSEFLRIDFLIMCIMKGQRPTNLLSLVLLNPLHNISLHCVPDFPFNNSNKTADCIRPTVVNLVVIPP